jgi:hypothetical protein
MSIMNFFKSSEGEVVIVQRPNLLIIAWLIVQVLLFLKIGPSSPFRALATAMLFTWAYMEIDQGKSPFRRCLGAVIMVVIVTGLFVR